MQQIHLKLKINYSTAKATDGLISNKTVGLVARLCNDKSITMTTAHSKSIISIQAENTEEMPREIYIPPQKNKEVLIKYNA